MTIMEIDSLRVAFGPEGNGRLVLTDVGFSVGAGQIVAIVGESGAGKSTLAFAISGLMQPGLRAVGGRIGFAGQDLLKLGPAQMRRIRGRAIGSIFQDHQNALDPVMTVGSQLTETIIETRGMTRGQARHAAAELLLQVGLAGDDRVAKSFPHQLSGGMRQRVVIALAFAGHPKLVIADEPTSSLDAALRGTILKLIRDLAKSRNTGVILITHDIRSVAAIADDMVILRDGKIVETGKTSDLMAQPYKAYTKSLVQTLPRHKPRTVAQGNEILRLEGICKSFKLPSGFMRQRWIRAVQDVDVVIRKGETFGLMGASGSGKSTLAKIAAGILAPGSGKIQLLAKRRHMVFQDPFASLNPAMTVQQTLAEPIRFLNLRPRQSIDAAVMELLDSVGLDAALAARYPNQLSGGQLQRVSIARALAAEPDFLICDEPTSALDIVSQRQILDLLSDLKRRRNLTLLLISHDADVIAYMADRVGIIEAGRVSERPNPPAQPK